MTRKKLRQIAHARSGDKGDILNISLIPYDDKYYELIKEQVTADKVKEQFKDLVKGNVTRYDLENIKSFNFVLSEALDGGVTRSLRLDKHGKMLSFLLLDIDVEI